MALSQQKTESKCQVAGLSEIFETPSLTGKIAWGVLFVVSLSLMSLEIYSVCTDYKRHPIITEQNAIKVSAENYPSVKLCPLYWINMSTAYELLNTAKYKRSSAKNTTNSHQLNNLKPPERDR